MKRLVLFLKKHAEEVKVNAKVKKVEAALQSATANAEEQKIDAELELQKIMEDVTNSTNSTSFIQEISSAFDKLEEAELTMERINKIKNYLNEEIEIKK